jgi:hypothetical protein
MSDIKCINLGYVCSNAEAASVEEVFRKHAAWMTDFYSEANNGNEHLLNAYFTKAPEFIDPTDPEKGVTGNTLFTINERFIGMASIQRHVENASQNDYFPQFAEILGSYGRVISLGGEIYHSIR